MSLQEEAWRGGGSRATFADAILLERFGDLAYKELDHVGPLLLLAQRMHSPLSRVHALEAQPKGGVPQGRTEFGKQERGLAPASAPACAKP